MKTRSNVKAGFVTPGGYTVEAEGKSTGWQITSPEGKTTRIWGD